MRIATDFLNAMGFMTRLGPCRVLSGEELGRSLAVFPLVGLALGVILVGPVWLGLLAGHPYLQGLLVVAGSMYLTRGLHWDGLSDVADAWGSGCTGERFWEILKDSRVGAFGVMGIALGLAGQILLFGECFEAGVFGPVLFASVLGRQACVTLAWAGRGYSRPGLGSLFMAGATRGRLGWSLAVSLVLGLACLKPSVLLLALALCGLAIHRLYRLGARQSGINGDFLGTAVLLGEMAPALAWALLPA